MIRHCSRRLSRTTPRIAPPIRILFGVAATLVAATWTGCSSTDSAPEVPRTTETTLESIQKPYTTVWGRVRDLDASVRWAAAELDMVVYRIIDNADDETREFELVTIRDEPGLLTVRGVVDAGLLDLEVRPFEVSAVVSRLGDPQREGELLDKLRDRLEELARR